MALSLDNRSASGNNFATLISTAPVTAWIGMTIVTIVLSIAILANFIAPYGEREIVTAPYDAWSWAHPLGTDNLGRDMLSRLIFGARNTVGLAIATTAVSFSIGITMGLLAAVAGGWVDLALGRLVDALMAVPQLVFALLILAVVGSSPITLIFVIATLDSTRVFRLSRSVGLSIMVKDFVDVARMRGEKMPWIIFREVLPNAAAPLAAEFGLRFCFVFLFVSALSFLGLGLQPPTADWGSMVRDNAQLIGFGQLAALIPASAIAFLTLGVNFIVDWYLRNTSSVER